MTGLTRLKLGKRIPFIIIYYTKYWDNSSNIIYIYIYFFFFFVTIYLYNLLYPNLGGGGPKEAVVGLVGIQTQLDEENDLAQPLDFFRCRTLTCNQGGI